MQAGKLNKIISIYAPECTINEYGEQELIYYKQYEVRAQVVYNGGNRGISNDEKIHSNTKTFKIRNHVKIDETYQIKYNNKFYRIISMDNITEWGEIVIDTELINE